VILNKKPHHREQVEFLYLQSPRSLARFTARNYGSIAVDWLSRQVTLTAHSESGTPQITKRLNLDEMGPGHGGECDSSSVSSAALMAVSALQSVFPQLSNTQCIVLTIVLFCVAAPVVFMVALVYASCRSVFVRKSRKIADCDRSGACS
jgi:hypothetical protein